MKLGISTWVWVSPLQMKEFEIIASRIAKMGFDLIEIPIDFTEDMDFYQMSKVLKANNLDVSVCAALGKGCDLIHENQSFRENAIKYIYECIEITQILGGKNLVGPFYSSAGRLWWTTKEEREREKDLLVDQLRLLAHYAMDHQVTLCVEPLNRYETSFLNTTAETIEIIDRVDHEACKIILDTFHMNIEEESIVDAFLAAGPRVKHVHVASSFRGAPGQGTIPWQEIVQGLRQIHYDGPVVIESFTPYAQRIALPTATWRPLAPSQDALASEGLSFLRKIFDTE